MAERIEDMSTNRVKALAVDPRKDCGIIHGVVNMMAAEAVLDSTQNEFMVDVAAPEGAITIPWEQDEYEPVRGSGVFTGNGKSIAVFEMVDKESTEYSGQWTVEEISYIRKNGHPPIGLSVVEYISSKVTPTTTTKDLVMMTDEYIAAVKEYDTSMRPPCFWKTWPAFMLYTGILSGSVLLVIAFIMQRS